MYILFQKNESSSCLIRDVSWSELNFFQRAEEFIVGERPNSEEEFQELWEELESLNASSISCPYGWEYDLPSGAHQSIVQDVRKKFYFHFVCFLPLQPLQLL